jgi:hypothetical protein
MASPHIEPVRIGAQRDPPALVLIYKQDGSKLRKRVMPLRGLITLEPGAATRKMVEAHRPFLDLDRISSTQLTEIVTSLVTDAAALPTAPPPAPSAARSPANEAAMPLTQIAAPPDPNIQPSAAAGVTKKSPTQGHLQTPSHKAAFQQKREAFERGLAPVAAPPPPVAAPIAAPPPPSIRIEPAASQHASPLKGVSTSPVELDRGLLHELAGDLDSSGYSSSDEARLKNKSSSGFSSVGAPAGIATTPNGAAPAKTTVPDTDSSLLRSVNFDDLESSTGSVDSLLGSIVSAGASPASSPAKAPAIAPAKAAPSKSTAQAAAAPAAAAPAAAAAAAAPAPAGRRRV